MTYEEWLNEIDAKLFKNTGVCLDMLPDWMSRDAYNDGLSVKEGYDIVLEECCSDLDDIDELMDEL